ncbi:g9539 [Coccomyxa elongata]
MGGGGLAFLNKKTWHPGRIQNQEEKWKREQAAAKEKSKLDEIRKQIAEERQREEIEAVAHAAGVKDKSDKLDWMYQGGMVARAEADKRNEEQLLGAKPMQIQEAAVSNRANETIKLPTFYAEDTAASANEVWQRIHSDPLFAIRQQEIAARKSIASNPVKMDAIKKEVAQIQAAQQAAKLQKKAAKLAKKDAKRAKREERKVEKRHAKLKGAAAEDGEGVDGRSNSEHPRKRTRTASPERRDDRDMARTGAQHAEKHRRNEGERERHRDHDHHRSRDGHSNGHSRIREEDGGRDREEHKRGDRDGHENGHHHRDHGERDRPRVYTDGASAQGADLKYGLNYGGAAPQALQKDNRSELAAATQKRLEEAAAKKEEEAQKAAQRHVRREYKTGRMTEEERQRRLAEMAGNAEVHEEARWARQKRARDADAAEEQANAIAAAGEQQPGGTAAFLKSATAEVYGTSGDVASLEDRVGRRKYYAECGGGHGFKR